MSIVDDELIERMRRYYCGQYQISYHPIAKTEEDYRAKRITAYLNLVQFVVNRQIEALKRQPFTENSELTKYFQLLPDSHPSKPIYHAMEIESNRAIKTELQDLLINYLKAGDIDVNIMSKVDKMNYQDGNLLDQRYSDASAALRGFANSTLHSSLILSAGMNPHLYAYLAELPAFFPNSEGLFDKKVVLKVSDFRSALIQAKYLAKRGVWVSEFRIESGLNCGGHAFATDGFLLGPILQEFKEKKRKFENRTFRDIPRILDFPRTVINNSPHHQIYSSRRCGNCFRTSVLVKLLWIRCRRMGIPISDGSRSNHGRSRNLKSIGNGQARRLLL
jgi:hypothetical protein